MVACNMEFQFELNNIRKRIITVGNSVGRSGAHFGSSLSLVEILFSVYSSLDINNLKRDRVVLSKGHGALGLFVILEHFKLMDSELVDKFEVNGSGIFAHASKSPTNNIEFSGGSLGLGLPFGVGIALSNSLKKISSKTVVILGDGECDEGIVWESLQFASHHKLSNLIVIVDNNKFQSDGEKASILNNGSLVDKFSSFGFETLEVDGHDVSALCKSLKKDNTNLPKAIIANTIKGKGVSFMEETSAWHHNSLNGVLFKKAMEELL